MSSTLTSWAQSGACLPSEVEALRTRFDEGEAGVELTLPAPIPQQVMTIMLFTR